MSVEFSNAYQEILLDNLMAIIKQNFVFQTQLKLMEDKGKQTADLQAKYDEIVVKYNAAQNDLQQIESYKSKATINDSAHQEKSRIQAALNDEMKKKAILQKDLETKDSIIKEKDDEIASLKDYIAKLEGIAPVSKLKKINSDAVKVEEPKPIEETTPVDLFKVTDGSSF